MKINLHNVQKTLLMPLWGRAQLTKTGNPLLTDHKALDIVEMIEYDFTLIEKSFSDFFNIGWVARAKMFDDTIKVFLSKNPEGTIVNLGAGLDTTFSRVDNGLLKWYDLDLPDVIEIRRKIIPETNRSKYIAISLFDPSWMQEIAACQQPVLLLAGGVLYYYSEEEIKEWFKKISGIFPGGEIVFDITSELALPYVNKGLQEKDFTSALIKWGINDAQKIIEWAPGIIILEEYPLFARVTDRDFWGKDIAEYMLKNDKTKGTSIVHIKFNYDKNPSNP